jgi:hypothetical protein
MTIGVMERRDGVELHLDPEECELFMRLARDAAQTAKTYPATTYLSLCVRLGQRIEALLTQVGPSQRV